MSGSVTTRVGYVIGMGRSGTTLLDRLIGMNEGVNSIGEAPAVWGGLLRDRVCSCSEVFSGCPFWRAVTAADPELFTRENAAMMVSVGGQILPANRLPRLLTTQGQERVIRQVGPQYLENLERLYRAIQVASGAQAIFDSTKNPAYGLALLATPGIDVGFIRLIRDPRAVAYSLSRVKANPSRGQGVMLRRYGPLRGSMYWNIMNAAADAVTDRSAACIRVAYEDFADDPDAQLKRVLDLLGVTPSRDEAAPYHTLGGNPIRMESTVVVRPDDEWRDRMSLARRALTTTATLPLLRRYGYRVRT